jgi:protein-S-isoprenylcysteine O-methyltransferase Ste14
MPYYNASQVAGALIGIALLGWFALEITKFAQGRRWQKGASTPGQRGWWLAAAACAITANMVMRFAPRMAPAAEIRPGASAFALGMVMLLAGIGLRAWSFRTLGQYFTFTVKVPPDQTVVSDGPYRLLRHPSYTGLMLITIGIGLASANWLALTVATAIWLAMILWRIRIEENAVLDTLGDSYRTYAADHKRLVPLVW